MKELDVRLSELDDLQLNQLRWKLNILMWESVTACFMKTLKKKLSLRVVLHGKQILLMMLSYWLKAITQWRAVMWHFPLRAMDML